MVEVDLLMIWYKKNFDTARYLELKRKKRKKKRNAMIKKSNKYNYIQGKQLTDPGSGTRVYEISNYRLPSVTTILGATANQDHF